MKKKNNYYFVIFNCFCVAIFLTIGYLKYSERNTNSGFINSESFLYPYKQDLNINQSDSDYELLSSKKDDDNFINIREKIKELVGGEYILLEVVREAGVDENFLLDLTHCKYVYYRFKKIKENSIESNNCEELKYLSISLTESGLESGKYSRRISVHDEATFLNVKTSKATKSFIYRGLESLKELNFFCDNISCDLLEVCRMFENNKEQEYSLSEYIENCNYIGDCLKNLCDNGNIRGNNNECLNYVGSPPVRSFREKIECDKYPQINDIFKILRGILESEIGYWNPDEKIDK